ncbi:MAG: endo-1,4-beta-xylanase [bacterium]|nr:MAG: endo-1,4-beta-xylanase [bacterium]
MQQSTIIFKPHFVQKGRGPHLDEFVFATDENGDTFHSNIGLTRDGVVISNTEGREKFGIHVRWNVEGFGYLFMTADNGGEFYQLPALGSYVLNLNLELAKSRVERNKHRLKLFENQDWKPSRQCLAYFYLSQDYLRDANQNEIDSEKCSRYAQEALKFGLLAGELLEIEKARFDVEKLGQRSPFLIGCDSRSYFQMDKKLFLERFSELFNYATITHYLIGDIVNFEPEEGNRHYAEREVVLGELRKRNITVAGRPLFWTHTWVTPDWLKEKKYPEVLKYLEKHIREVVGHYGDEIQVWEVVNELHDWANELELNHEQTIELTKLACDVARDANPRIRLLINNCCPFAHYVQMGKWHEKEAKYPQRTPHQFVKQLIEAEVDFNIVGVQMYFTKQVFSDFIQLIERYEQFGKSVHLAEVGAPSIGISQEFLDKEDTHFSTLPYEWHRHWDEELQADWLEYIFTFAYSKPWIEAANWYDFVDPYSFLKNGGLLRSVNGEKKAAVDRLLKLKKKWNLH